MMTTKSVVRVAIIKVSAPDGVGATQQAAAAAACLLNQNRQVGANPLPVVQMARSGMVEEQAETTLHLLADRKYPQHMSSRRFSDNCKCGHAYCLRECICIYTPRNICLRLDARTLCHFFSFAYYGCGGTADTLFCICICMERVAY